MITKHVALNATNGGHDGASLVDDFETMPALVNHLLETTYLTFDSPKPRDLPAMIDGIVIDSRCIGATTRHEGASRAMNNYKRDYDNPAAGFRWPVV